MTNRAGIFALLGLAVVGGLFFAFRPPEDAPVARPEAAPTASPADAADAPTAPSDEEVLPELRIFRIEVTGGQLESGPTVIQVEQGESITLQVVSDRADEFHLHGYDLRLDLEPNTPATLHIEADRSGRFGYELHSAHREIGVLEVRPR